MFDLSFRLVSTFSPRPFTIWLVYYLYFYANLVSSPFGFVDDVMRAPNERLTGYLVSGMFVYVSLSACVRWECVCVCTCVSWVCVHMGRFVCIWFVLTNCRWGMDVHHHTGFAWVAFV